MSVNLVVEIIPSAMFFTKLHGAEAYAKSVYKSITKTQSLSATRGFATEVW